MATVTLLGEELARGDLPGVCIRCGSRSGVTFVQRAFVWRPYFSPWMLLRIIPVRRLTTYVPLCREHGGFNWLPHRRGQWWGLRPVGIEHDRMTLAGVADDFVVALRRRRQGQRDDDDVMEVLPADAPRSRRSRTWQDPYPTRRDSSWIVPLVLLCVPLLGFGGLCLIGGIANLLTPHPPVAPPAWPTPTPAPVAMSPAAPVEPQPENVVVGLLGVAADGGPGGLPWGPLALAGRRETFHLLADADLDRALADLKSPNASVVGTAARRLAVAKPTPDRREETAKALLGAMANPFPSTRQYVAEALGVWGNSDDAPALITMLGDLDPNARSAAMTALAALKEERGAAAVASRLSNFLDRPTAIRALTAMGPLAEKAVAPLASQGNSQTRIAACAVLAAVGTAESLPALETAARDPDINVVRAAADAVRAVKSRQ